MYADNLLVTAALSGLVIGWLAGALPLFVYCWRPRWRVVVTSDHDRQAPLWVGWCRWPEEHGGRWSAWVQLGAYRLTVLG